MALLMPFYSLRYQAYHPYDVTSWYSLSVVALYTRVARLSSVTSINNFIHVKLIYWNIRAYVDSSNWHSSVWHSSIWEKLTFVQMGFVRYKGYQLANGEKNLQTYFNNTKCAHFSENKTIAIF